MEEEEEEKEKVEEVVQYTQVRFFTATSNHKHNILQFSVVTV